MRLHTLEITAFGPFADTVRVDFDALFESSVFLLCGDTGAGKTTVLDAVCFALYGDVPGDRGAARQLRSQHAAPGLAPRVVLEVDVAGRRFRFTRSPAWQRPKKRGTGVTTEQARVLVEERVGPPDAASWTTRCTRLDEAGHLVGDVLGMTIDQFSQVVLLPQGEFDTFLRSSSEDRQRVLTQLFRTRRFEDVERWLVERRTSLRRASQAHRDRVTALLHRLSESADVTLPDWDLDRAVADHDVRRWSAGLVSTAEETVRSTELGAERADVALLEASAALDAARRTSQLRARHATATERARRLAEQTDRITADSARCEAAGRAAEVHPLARQAVRAAEEAERTRSHATRAVGAVSDDLDLSDPILDADELAERATTATARAAVAREFVPRARDLESASHDLAHTAQLIQETAAGRQELAARVDAAPALLADELARLERVRARVAALAPAQLRAAELGRLLSQFAVAEELEFQVADARRKRDAQHQVSLELRERLHEVRERRLAGMAAELAARMAVGSDCPVCGSHDHPAPATASSDAPSQADEQALRVRIDDAAVTLLTHDDHVHGYQARLRAVRDGLGDRTVEQVTADLEAARLDVVDAVEATRAEPGARDRYDDLLAAQREDAAALGRAEAALATARERHVALQDRVTRLSEELAAILDRAEHDPGSADQVSEVVRAHERSAALLLAARDALVQQHGAETAVTRAAAAAHEAAQERGFADVDQAVAAVLGDAELEGLRTAVETWRRLGAEVAAELGDPEVVAAAAGPQPDLTALTLDHDTARLARDHATTAARAAHQRAARVTARSAELGDALASWEPVRVEHARAVAVSELAEGRGADNTRQVRLSAYVLATRLSQVVAAANERLVRMTDDRFLLEHTAERGVGERRGGLSLLVRDQWTDEVRDPVTLSGGETFVVSLALALGLADVVTGEAGGARIDTLFVDEGFGSLDADTLELVMDTLDQLRDGGRVVGLVSHVAELRTRVPTQLVVHKTRAGSSLEQRYGSG